MFVIVLFLSYRQCDGNNQKYMVVMGWTILNMDYDSCLIMVLMLCLWLLFLPK